MDAAQASLEHPLAHLIDDLAGLGDGELDRDVHGGVAVGADETVLLAHPRDLLLDHARGLIAAAFLVGRGANYETVVFDRVADRAGAAGRGFAAKNRFPK